MTAGTAHFIVAEHVWKHECSFVIVVVSSQTVGEHGVVVVVAVRCCRLVEISRIATLLSGVAGVERVVDEPGSALTWTSIIVELVLVARCWQVRAATTSRISLTEQTARQAVGVLEVTLMVTSSFTQELTQLMPDLLQGGPTK